MSVDEAILGRYRLVERIAAGGMAEVYLARMTVDEGFEKTVVVKTILPQHSSDADLGKMMLDEARIGFELRHQNIAQVLDVGREQNTLFIAIEHIDGLDMARVQQLLAADDERLDPLLVTYVAVEVLRALDYAHRRTDEAGRSLGIIHRDLSPHNILLSDEGEVKLTDFGIARARDRLAQTATGGTKGKVAYMAPEQARGEAIDHRADLFGLAATLYEALCGEPPFAGKSSLQQLERARRGVIEPLTQRCPELDSVLAGVIDQALAHEPDQRPASAAEMRAPLEELLRGHAPPATALADLLRRLAATRRRHAADNQRFARALLGHGTDASSLAIGTPTKPTVQSPPQPSSSADLQLAATPPAPATTDVVRTGTVVVARSRATMIAVILVALGALTTLAVIKLGGSESRPPPPPPAVTAAVVPAATIDAGVETSPDATPVALAPVAAPAKAAPAKPVARKPGRARPRAAPAATEYGTVTINALPWAKVTIDGKSHGNTPARRLKLSAGPHKLRLVNPESKQSLTKTITVVANEHRTFALELGK